MLLKFKSGDLNLSTMNIIQNRKHKKHISLNAHFLLAFPILCIIPNWWRRCKFITTIGLMNILGLKFMWHFFEVLTYEKVKYYIFFGW